MAREHLAGLASEKDGQTYWRYRLLEAEALLQLGETAEAGKTLEEPFPEGDGFDELRAVCHRLHAYLKRKQSKYEEALRWLHSAERFARQPGDAHELREVLAMRVSILTDAERPEAEALLLQLRADPGFDNEPYLRAGILINLTKVLVDTWRWEEAASALQEAESAARKVPNELMQATVWHNLAHAYFRLGDHESAFEFIEKALRVYESRGTVQPQVRIHGARGRMLLLLNRPAEAVPWFEKAVTLARQHQYRKDEREESIALASALLQAGNASDVARAASLIETVSQPGFVDVPLLPDDLDFIQIDRGLIAARTDSAKAIAIFNQLARSSARSESRWLAHIELARLHAGAANSRLSDRHFESALLEIAKSHASVQKDGFQISFLGRLMGFFEEYVARLLARAETAEALRVTEASRARVLTRDIGGGASARFSAQLQALRRYSNETGTVFLSYWISNWGSQVWVIARGVFETVSLAKADYRKLVAAHREQLEKQQDPLANGHHAGRQLFDLLVAPVAKFIPDGSRVVIVPGEHLHGLNFETLPVNGGKPRYWVDDVVLSVAPSLSALASDVPSAPPHRSLLLIGDPLPIGEDFPALPHASAEMNLVAKHFAAQPQRYEGALANRSAYLAGNPGSFSHIHFASHANANSTDPLDSAVILSPEGGSFSLYARDVMDKPIRAELVTLSGCRGAGTRSYSGEGLIGFAWAFLRAGSRGVIAGLWDVSDASTAQLMDALYQNLARGADPAAALRAAKLYLRRAGANYGKPFYWGPFQHYTRVLPKLEEQKSAGLLKRFAAEPH